MTHALRTAKPLLAVATLSLAALTACGSSSNSGSAAAGTSSASAGQASSSASSASSGAAGPSASSSGATVTSGTGKANPTIALILPNHDAPRYEQQDRPKFESALKAACPQCKMIYYNSNASVATQQSQAESAIAQGADVISFVPADVKAAASIVQKAHAKHVKVIALGRGVVGATPDALVTYDPLVVGQQQATTLLADMKAQGLANKQIVMINGAPTDDLAMGFKKGAHQVLDSSGVKIGREFDTPNWDPAVAQTEMDQAITALGKDQIGGVIAANDTTAGSVVASMKNHGMDPHKIPITGLDADLAGLQRILDGVQAMTVYQPILLTETANAKIAVALGRGEPIPKDLVNGPGPVPAFFFKTVIVTAANMKDTVAKEPNYVDLKKLCAAPYDVGCKKFGIQ
ncbi:MAG: D-xylose transport system substrate-binding protein [Frankiales bacterium]|nr:D-xylose transport system substrate-binding protein [Frankiales bacterium]